VSKTDRIFIAGKQHGMVEGVRRGSGEGLVSANVIGDDSYNDGGWRGQFGGCRFRYGSTFSRELKFDTI
jgi:hypothetical protein